MSPEEKFNKLCEYPGFVYTQSVGELFVKYSAYLTFPSGDESNHYYDEDRDKVIDRIFYRYETLMINTCYIVEMEKIGRRRSDVFDNLTI